MSGGDDRHGRGCGNELGADKLLVEIVEDILETISTSAGESEVIELRSSDAGDDISLSILDDNVISSTSGQSGAEVVGGGCGGGKPSTTHSTSSTSSAILSTVLGAKTKMRNNNKLTRTVTISGASFNVGKLLPKPKPKTDPAAIAKTRENKAGQPLESPAKTSPKKKKKEPIQTTPTSSAKAVASPKSAAGKRASPAKKKKKFTPGKDTPKTVSASNKTRATQNKTRMTPAASPLDSIGSSKTSPVKGCNNVKPSPSASGGAPPFKKPTTPEKKGGGSPAANSAPTASGRPLTPAPKTSPEERLLVKGVCGPPRTAANKKKKRSPRPEDFIFL